MQNVVEEVECETRLDETDDLRRELTNEQSSPRSESFLTKAPTVRRAAALPGADSTPAAVEVWSRTTQRERRLANANWLSGVKRPSIAGKDCDTKELAHSSVE